MRELDAKDPKPGYSSLGGFGDGVQVHGFLPIWTPGSRPRTRRRARPTSCRPGPTS